MLRSIARAALLASLPALAGAQLIFTAFTPNPGCTPASPPDCAVLMGPSGAALFARQVFGTSVRPGAVTESFEGIPPGVPGGPLDLDFGRAGIGRLQGPGAVDINLPARYGTGAFAATGTRYYGGVASGTASTITLTFAQAIAGIGVYGVDLGDDGAGVTVELRRAGVTVARTTLLAPTDGASRPEYNGGLWFIGMLFEANTFDALVLGFTGGTAPMAESFVLDDVIALDASQVAILPEPSSVMLLAAGLLAVGWWRRRQRRSSTCCSSTAAAIASTSSRRSPTLPPCA